VARICSLVGGGVFLTCHRGAGDGGEYGSVSRLEFLIGNRRLVVLECANCSLHATVEGAQSETDVTVSLSTVHRLSL